MGMVLWIVFGAFAAWAVSTWMGRRVGEGAGLSIVAGAVGAAAAGAIFGSVSGFDYASLWRVSTVFVGAVGILVMASLSTGGRLR